MRFCNTQLFYKLKSYQTPNIELKEYQNTEI